MKRVRVVSALVIVALIGVVGLSLFAVYRDWHQHTLDRQLIEAIKRMDANAALAALNAGADPNARDLPPDNRTLFKRICDLVLYRRSAMVKVTPPCCCRNWNEPALDIVFDQVHIWYRKPPNSFEKNTQNPAFAETVCHALLEHGANPNAIMDRDQLALFSACFLGLEPCVRDLVNHGANVNSVNSNGRNALTTSYDDPPITAYLLSKGADPNHRDTNGITALLGQSDIRCIELMLRYGARPDAVDGIGNTMLLDAVNNSERDKVALLLQYGANPYHRNENGQDAFDHNNDLLRQETTEHLHATSTYRHALRVHVLLEQYRKTHPETHKSGK